MHPAPITRARRHDLGVLLVGGDWACAHGDLAGLAEVAKRLGSLTKGEIRTEAFTLARLCVADHQLAAGRWFELRTRMHAA